MIKKYNDQKAASEAMAEDFKAIALKAVEQNDRFTLALTGGSSPLKLHEILSSEPYKKSIPWEKCFIFWGDERAVPFDDDQNNAKMGYKTLLDHVAIPSDQIFRMNSEVATEKAADEYEKQLKEHFSNQEPSFDLILLGMGADGHTASIFPGSEVVNEQTKWVSTGYNSEQKTQRITLTAPLINKAKNIFFAVYGEGKAKTLLNVLYGEYNPELLPSQLIKPVSGKLYWYIDEEAGRFITKDKQG